MKNTVVTFRAAKGQGKLAVLTAYDYSTARVMDAVGVNALLVGDSLGMVMLGHEDTLGVTVDDMVRHSAAVARGAEQALVICDMPYMSYHTGVDEAVRNAGRLVTEGRAQAVKLEGAIVLEEIGRNLTPSPFLTSSVMAATALGQASDELRGRYLPGLLSGDSVFAVAIDEGPITLFGPT